MASSSSSQKRLVSFGGRKFTIVIEPDMYVADVLAQCGKYIGKPPLSLALGPNKFKDDDPATILIAEKELHVSLVMFIILG